MELPEIVILSRQMDEALRDKTVARLEVANPKCLNMPLDEFRSALVGRTVEAVEPRGKWVFISLDGGLTLLYNTGMGADTLYFKSEAEAPEKYHQKVVFSDGSGFTVRVYWFSYLHLVHKDRLGEHRLTAGIGPSPLDPAFTLSRFRELLDGKRRAVKGLLTDQRVLAGIGNVYIHDPLFLAGVHPLRKANTLTDAETGKLYDSIRMVLNESLEAGGLAYERNFYGEMGGYGKGSYRVAYKEGEPCPVCGTAIEKIRMGSTSSYVCPRCQPLPREETFP
ncbi:MAG TPA: DNA-formamidopyrimidine glycosylase family protein [Candidatus Bathyarchaeia archaeon]